MASLLNTSKSPSSAIFKSLSQDSRPWNLTRTLRSSNPADLQGNLAGTASFTELQPSEDGTSLLYNEEGYMPDASGRSNMHLKWSRNYIWQLSRPAEGATGLSDELSVWFTKPAKRSLTADAPAQSRSAVEVDYLFHRLGFDAGENELVPPPASDDVATRLVFASGEHLCIDDMYKTTYAFRVADDGKGELLSFASRHIVEGPKKQHDIINLYDRIG